MNSELKLFNNYSGEKSVCSMLVNINLDTLLSILLLLLGLADFSLIVIGFMLEQNVSSSLQRLFRVEFNLTNTI